MLALGRCQRAFGCRGPKATRRPISLAQLQTPRCNRHGGSSSRWCSRAVPEAQQPGALDIGKLAELISAGPMDDEQKQSLERIAAVLDVPLATAKQMAFKKRGVLAMDVADLESKLQAIADIVDVPLATAKEMVAIQPGLLFNTERQAEALKMGIRAICYELKAPKEEVVDLILKNQSVLHGREMHLSVADIAHLAMLRQPVGRIVD